MQELPTSPVHLLKRAERELFEEFDPREVETLNGLFGRLIASAEQHSYHPKLRSLPRAAAKAQSASVARKAPSRRRATARS